MENKISFCTVSMNRAHHIEKTLPQNILDNEDYSNCEFILLDYNSSDGLEEFVKTQLKKYIDNGKLIYYKTLTPTYFHRGHSLNTAFKLSTGDIVCTIDADNYTGKGFASYINMMFNRFESIFLAVDLNIYSSDVCGRVCSRSDDFFKIGGYDETMDCWGHDDDDIKNRLALAGLEKKHIQGGHFLNAISHGHEDRLANEYLLKFLKEIYLCHWTPSISHVLILLNNQKFQNIVFLNSPSLNSYSYNNCLNPLDDYYINIDEEEGYSGDWHVSENNKKFELITKEKDIFGFVKNGKNFQLDKKGNIYNYREIKDKNFIELVIKEYSYAKNRIKLRKNSAANTPVVNLNMEIGRGIVYKNFDYDNPI
ncbi:glycosyltransferase family 2 protein [Maribacter sp. 2307UL18-2]|uniref:glycosyltransferase family 2 protein n=1 Tax=Maribacter sp. 2307UL18-2 TaxID=3386274 RepID=UPI0039BD4F76